MADNTQPFDQDFSSKSKKRTKTSRELRAASAGKSAAVEKPHGKLVRVPVASVVRSITVEQWARSKRDPIVAAFVHVQSREKREKLSPEQWQSRYQAFLKEPR